MRIVKLMADYQCYPLWEASSGVVGNIDPQDLPISPSLRQRLMAWAGTFDSTLNMDDPANSGFRSEEAANEFMQEEGRLAQDLQQELGSGFQIIQWGDKP